MPAAAAPAPRRKVLLATSLVVFPAALFYAILAWFSVNIPLLDDYDSGFEYLNQLTQQPTFGSRFFIFITAQHNEYKTIFANAVAWLEVAVLGRIDFRLTSFLGDIFILLLAILLWKMFLPQSHDRAMRLTLFIPVSLLLFQLNYAETVDWSMTSLQHLPALTFALAAIYFLMQRSLSFYMLAIAATVLSISSSTNGFLVVPIGLCILAIDRRYARLVAWLAVTAACLGVYAFHYNPNSSQSPSHGSIFHQLLHIHPIFILSFLGNSFFFPKILSCFIGLLLLAALAYMARSGYYRTNPTVAYCIVFLLLTTLGVAGIRSEAGLALSTSSRYRIYSDFLLIFSWFFVVEHFPRIQHNEPSKNPPLLAAIAFCLLFSFVMDGYGVFFLARRDRALIGGLRLFEHPQPGQPPGPVMPGPDDSEIWKEWQVWARENMIRSIQLGIYRPPSY
jgi:hypothetical protein